MTYRELLQLYQTGQLDEHTAADVKAEIEKHDAIGDYLFEEAEGHSGIGDLSAIQEQGSQESQFTAEIQKTVRRTFWKLGISVGAVVLILVLFIVFGLPHMVDWFYYDPTEVWEKTDSCCNERINLDLSVWTELFYPCGYRDSAQVEPLGYGKYFVTFPDKNKSDDRASSVSGMLTRNHLRLYDPNAFNRDDFLFFKPEDLPTDPAALAEAKRTSFQYADEHWNDDEIYTAYLTLPSPVPYETLYLWAKERGISDYNLWFKVYTQDVPMYWAAFGFPVSTAPSVQLQWDEEKYPNLVQDTQLKFEEEPVKEHFLSLLAYTKDHPEFLKALNMWATPQMDEILDGTIQYVEENGLIISGFCMAGKKEDFMQLQDDPMVCYISPFTLY